MELRGLIEKHQSLEDRARDMIRDQLAIVLAQLQQNAEFDALPPIVEPQPEIIEYVFSQAIRHNQDMTTICQDF
jgi:hypothetical protein